MKFNCYQGTAGKKNFKNFSCFFFFFFCGWGVSVNLRTIGNFKFEKIAHLGYHNNSSSLAFLVEHLHGLQKSKSL